MPSAPPQQANDGFQVVRSFENVDKDEEILRLISRVSALERANLPVTPAPRQSVKPVTPALPAINPAQSVTDVGSTDVVGTSTNYAREDHQHKGVHSVNGMFGDVTVGGGGSITPFNNGNLGSTHTIDWNNGSNQYGTLNQPNCTLTFTNGTDGGQYTLELIQGSGNNMVTWPSNMHTGSISLTLTTTVNLADLFALYVNENENFVPTGHNSGYTP